MRYTRFEVAAIIGSRALQISLGAPVLVGIPKGVTECRNLALLEFYDGKIPVTVKRDAGGMLSDY